MREGDPVGEEREVSRACSRVDALNQCGRFIGGRRLQRVETTSTSAAAEMVGLGTNHGEGAICSLLAARHYGLTVVDENVGDSAANSTMFHVVSQSARTPNYGRAATRAAIVLGVPNDRGSLRDAFETLREWNVCPVYTIPTGHAGSQRFYLEVEGDLLAGADGGRTLAALRNVADVLVLGSYPMLEVA